MEAAAIVFTVLFTVCVLPLAIIMHYVTKWKATKGLSEREEKMLEDLWNDSRRLESRLSALEVILDDEVPDWRKRV